MNDFYYEKSSDLIAELNQTMQGERLTLGIDPNTFGFVPTLTLSDGTKEYPLGENPLNLEELFEGLRIFTRGFIIGTRNCQSTWGKTLDR